MKPASTKILVIKGRLNKSTASGIALPGNLEPHMNVGLVVAMGSAIERIDTGAEAVLFNGYLHSAAWDDLGTKEAHVIIDEVAVLATLSREEAEKKFNVTFESEVATAS